jgi:Condensation domain
MVDLSHHDIGELSDVIRPLNSLEHLFWLTDQNRPFHFAVTAQVSGETSVRDWREALARLKERHSLLSASIEGKPGAVPWFRQVNTAPIPLRVVHGDPQSRWEAEVAEELATPFDPRHAPLVRAVLIHATDNAAFTLVAHHAIADGMSLAYAVRDTLRALSGAVLEPLPSTPSLEEMLWVDGATSGPTIADEQQPEALPGNPGVYRPRDKARPQVRGLRLTPALTASLRDRARREATTVHGALCAALINAGRRVPLGWQDVPVRILSPVNIRRLLGVGQNCGVFVSAASSVLDLRITDFWELARQAKADVASGQTRASIEARISHLRHVVGNGLDVAAASDFMAGAFAHEAVVTNLGHLPFGGQFGHVELKALWGPCVLAGFEDEQTIGAATVDGSLCLTYTSHTPRDGLLEAMGGVLSEACSDQRAKAALPLAGPQRRRTRARRQWREIGKASGISGPPKSLLCSKGRKPHDR